MPFRPELEKAVENFPSEIKMAVYNMMAEASNKTINISTAISLILQHIAPLSSKIHISKSLNKKTTFDSIDQTGKYISLIYSHQRNNYNLEYSLGQTLRYISRCCAKKYTRQLKIDPYDISGFCYLCWRHTVQNNKFCSTHNSNNKAAYKYGTRLLKNFHEEIHKTRLYDDKNKTYDTFPFMTTDKRSSPKNVSQWIKKHRPNVWNHFDLDEIDIYSKDFYSELLNKIDESINHVTSHSNDRNKLHAKIINNPAQLAGILERCEAWLRADKTRKANRGGARANSGRKITK